MENNIHGILLIHKPSGITSHDVINQVRRRLGTKEVGHAGTLDPLAEGLMVLLVGEATKMSNYVLERNKQYEVTLKLGLETDTLDITGKILREYGDIDFEDQEVIEKAKSLQGDFNWEVPIYSATKVAGKKLYEHARSGQEIVEIPRKPMSFWEVEYLTRKSEPYSYQFRLNCSKGSFIRTWVQQLGMSLGCGAVMTELTRTYSAPYKLQNAVELESLSSREKLSESGAFIPMLAALPEFKIIRVSGASEALIRNGQISHELRRRLIIYFNPETDIGIKILSQRPEELLALVGLEPGKGFVVRRVFRY
jgi:tRNA pseudouridine55 synthase